MLIKPAGEAPRIVQTEERRSYRMRTVVTDPKFHAHDPTAMLKALDVIVRKCPDLSGFWNWDNAARMKFFSNLVVRYIKLGLSSKKTQKARLHPASRDLPQEKPEI